ncbi:MAG TPA: fibronectin type III domain-containing protein, partial [Clostridiaceae bacterium]|nr:fibronectin type III domain-containing protein [Clostridiaceae bacterium]
MVNGNIGCTFIGIRNFRCSKRLNVFLRFTLIIAIICMNLFTGQMNAKAAMNVTAVPAVPDTDTQVSLKWTSVAGASYYDIYKDGQLIYTIDVGKDLNYTSYIDTACEPETTYHYEVQALDSQGTELERGSASVTTSKMLAPSNLTSVFDVNTRQITLKWVNRSAAAAKSVIKRVDGTETYTVDDGSNEYTFDGPPPDDNTPLKYVVMSKDISEQHSSPDSNVAVVVPIQPPTISAMMGNGTATISWGSYPHISYFALERSKWDGSGWSDWETVYYSLTGGSAKDTPSEAGAYRYRLAAKDGSGYAGYSNISDNVSKPAAPSNLKFEILNPTQVKITWENNPDNTCDLMVQRRTGSSGTYSTIAILRLSEQEYIDTYNFTLNTIYYYRIVAYDNDNNKSISVECP